MHISIDAHGYIPWAASCVRGGVTMCGFVVFFPVQPKKARATVAIERGGGLKKRY